MELDDRAIETRLYELDTLETVSVFCRAFYRLIAGLVCMIGEERSVRVALVGMLDVELRYHRDLQRLAEREQVQAEELQGVTERHRIGLYAVCEYARQVERREVLTEAVCDLVLAECSYHLRRTAEVVVALERVIGAGINQPLIQFALGYNRYLLALENCAQSGGAEGEVVVRDPVTFRVQCLRAVSALEDGLQGTGLDGQLYWWIGIILDAAGLTEAAQDAYDKSAKLLHPEQQQDGMRPDESKSWRQQEPVPRDISDEEVRQAGRLLSGPFNPSWLLDAGQDER